MYSWLIPLILGTLLGGVLLWVRFQPAPKEEAALLPEPPAVSTELEGPSVEVSIYHPRADLSGLERQKVLIPDRRDTLSGWVRSLVSELSHSPSGEGVAIFPEGVELRHVFADDQGGLFLDFSTSLVERSQISLQMENLALKALIRTLSENLPGYRSLGLLVEGKEPETLWGHIYTRKPFAFERS